MSALKTAGRISLWLLLISITAIGTSAIKQRFADGPNRVFSGASIRLSRAASAILSIIEDLFT